MPGEMVKYKQSKQQLIRHSKNKVFDHKMKWSLNYLI